MAAKPTKPRKFKQARKDAKSAAKKAFSGKTQARLKDPMSKLELVDKEALKEVGKEAKGNYITDDRGNKIQTKPTETAKERIAREKKAAMEKFRARVAAEDGTSEKPAKKKPIVKKSTDAKPSVKKPSTTSSASAPKSLKTPEGKARYEKLIKEGIKPKSALNKALFYEAKLPSQRGATPTTASESKPKVKKTSAVKGPKSFKAITDASLTANEDNYLKKTQEKLIKQGKLSGSKELAIRPKGDVAVRTPKTVATTTSRVTPIPGSDTVVKKKGGTLKKIGKGGLLLGLASEVLQLPQSIKDQTRKDELEDLIAGYKGKKKDSALKNAGQSVGNSLEQIANSVSFGFIGKRRSDKIPGLEAQLAKAEKAANKNLRYGPDGSSLVPGTDAYKKGSPTPPSKEAIEKYYKDKKAGGGASGGPSGGASGGPSGGSSGSSGKGGTTPKVTPGSTYVVKPGDTLSAIAKASGVKLTDIYAANKKFKQNPKYKGGNMIWSGTTVKIPKK
jgi:LysM repeat protein